MNRYSGYSSISSNTVAKLRAAFSRDWATVHHHATSMWVCLMQVAITVSSPARSSYSAFAI